MSTVKRCGIWERQGARVLAIVPLLLCGLLFWQVPPSGATTLNVVGVNRNPAGTPAGTLPPAPTPVGSYYWTLEEDLMFPIVPGDNTTNGMSVSFHKSYMPVIASGCVDPAAGPTNLQCQEGRGLDNVTLDPGKRYFVSVLPLAGGTYTNGGASIAPGQTDVTVYVNQLPLPTAQVTVFVHVDNTPLNGFYDAGEQPLEGFTVYLIDAGGRYGMSGGPMFTDAFGNPLGTEYDYIDANGNGRFDPDEPLVLDAAGAPVIADGGNAVGMGFLLTDSNGMATFRHVAPGKLSVVISPPEGEGWSQTTTIEGSRVIDAWVKPNEPPFLLEFGPPLLHMTYGFVKPFADNAYFPGAGGHTVAGQIVNDHIARPPAVASFPGAPFKHTTPWVGLNDSATGKGIYATRANPDGTFSIANLKPGTYQLVVWDDYLDIIINFSTVIVGASDVNLGKVPVIHWFARHEHQVFLDQNGNGYPDPGEAGVPGQAINLRWRDGTMYQSLATDDFGWIAFNEIFPFFDWQIAEVDFLRYNATGATITVDDGGPITPLLVGDYSPGGTFGGQLNPQLQYCTQADINAGLCATLGAPLINPNTGDNRSRTELGPVLLEGFQQFAGQTSVFQWGKKPYGPGENGGITGIVQYSVTRAEDDPGQGVAEPWEPGIPGVQVNLYRDCNWDGHIDLPASGPTGCLDTDPNRAHVLADVDNYPFQWTGKGDTAHPDYTGVKGAEDIDRNSDGIFDPGDAVQVTWTDSWDENIPTGCQGPPYTFQGQPTDCFDGLQNFNQARPAVFDGGYAFGTAATGDPASLAHGVYIVEAVPPPGYELVREEEKNVDFGDNYVPQDPPLSLGWLTDTGTPLPPVDPFIPGGTPLCVGDRHFVQSELSLFPGVAGAFAGQARRLCDRKLVVLNNGENPAANFFFLTRAPIAGHIAGLVTDDITNDPRPGSPNAGEKYSPPWLPIAIRDWTGREILRTYSDQFGRYNALVPSTYTANTPLPSGMTPQMLVACLNSPMMPDPASPGQFVQDPNFNKYYGQFCYTLQYMPGATTYLDTPVLPTSAYVGPTQPPLDCECENGTPVIHSVTNAVGTDPLAGQGPYVSATGQQISIFAPPTPIVPGRDNGFGSTPGTVKIGNSTLTVAAGNWLPNRIVATVPAGTTTGQLTVTRSNGRSTKAAVTVTVGGPAPTQVGSTGSIQAAIDAAGPGDLIHVLGRHDEMVIMWKPVRLQGWGAGVSTIDAIATPFEKVEIWRQKVAALHDTESFTALPGQATDYTAGLNVIGAGANVLLESPGVMVLAKDASVGGGGFGLSGGAPNARIDGFNIVGSVNGGGIIVNGYAHYLQIANNRVTNNMGVAAGGIRVGHADLVNPSDPTRYQSAFNDHLSIHHNMVTRNSGTTRGAGGVMLGTGSDSYDVTENWICGNITLGDGGGGIGHQGLSNNGKITYNKILFNEAWSNQSTGEGGGIFIGGLPPLAGTVLSEGSGSVTVNANLVQGNGAGAGNGGGIGLNQVNGQDVAASPGSQTAWYFVNLFNNIIVNNVAGLAGGGISMQDVARGRIIHNTVANNDSTATATAAFTGPNPLQSTPQPAGIASRAHSAQLAAASGQTFSNPQLVDDIIWHNRSFSAVQNPTTLDWSLQPAVAPWVYTDLGVLGTAAPAQLDPTWSILTDTTNYGPTNVKHNKTVNNPNSLFVSQYFNGISGDLPGVFDEGGNFLRVVFGPLSLTGNYHVQGNSPAISSGTNLSGTYGELATDYDRDPRPWHGPNPDIGADEE